ncbi:ComF family protein [Streptomyces globosus]|uniref:ComF family protein n=1 Tax=Streptomyces globosus TaxID=68209 RepID=UPI0031E3B305
MRAWWRELSALVLPSCCAGCGAGREVLCAACARALAACPAGRVVPAGGPPGLPAVYAAAAYGGPVRSVLLAHKERGALPLAGPLGGALAGAVLAAVLRAALGAVLVPVPSARAPVRARGHDPVRRIALAAAGRLRRAGVAARVAPVLRQVRPVADQAGLGARERRANLAGALGVRRGAGRLAAGAPIVLVDDVATTGATLAEAARAVAEAGLGAVQGAAVVAAPHGAFVRIRPFTQTDQPCRE